jgi:hypothetical protein
MSFKLKKKKKRKKKKEQKIRKRWLVGYLQMDDHTLPKLPIKVIDYSKAADKGGHILPKIVFAGWLTTPKQLMGLADHPKSR